jgi:hypothetical protein
VLSTTIAMRRASDGTSTVDPAAAGIVERAAPVPTQRQCDVMSDDASRL